jgi:prepilin-type N-terminal cleavage/methylation domain-containing protein
MRWQSRRSIRRAFSLIEVLIAVAVSLLMLAALSQSFVRIGQTLKTSRSDVSLTSRTRDVSQRLRDELRRCTAPLTPPLKHGQDQGYLVYFDGPWSDATTLPLQVGRNVDLPLSKYGDVDDYLAFTAYAGDQWFTGKVPAYVLNGATGDPLIDMAPTVITSKYAEVVYWLEPEYAIDAATGNLVVDGNGFPLFRDVLDFDPTNANAGVGDGFPDRFVLHRRVLLIRPDLNTAVVNVVSTPNIPVLPSIQVNGFQTVRVASGFAVNRIDELIGMQHVHQLFDLSVRRVFDPVTGIPTEFVACNSLADLSSPHNRFAHVRMPLGGGGLGGLSISSMPILALGNALPDPSTLTNWQATSLRPTFALTNELNGFLLPAFVLNAAARQRFNDPRWDRRGEDVVMTGVLGFDVRGWDPQAPVVMTGGSDGGPGRIGQDDNGDGINDDVLELGAAGSDDIVLTPTDPGFLVATRSPLNAATLRIVDRGAYVDVDFARKVGGFFAADITIGSKNLPAPTVVNLTSLLDSPLSGFSATSNYAAVPVPDSYLKSGKFNPGTGAFYQPAYDTFSDGYETDGFDQGPDAITGTPLSTIWRLNSPAGVPLGVSNGIDLGRDGIDNNANALIDESLEEETASPIIAPLRGLQVRIRAEDPDTRLIKQMTVELDDRPQP